MCHKKNINHRNIILIIFLLIIIYFIYLNYTNSDNNDSNYKDSNCPKNTLERLRNTNYFDNDANYQYIINDNKKSCTNFNCKKNNDEDILLVGTNESNTHIFKYKNDLYTAIDDKLVLYNNENIKNNENNENKITYLEFPTKVPTNMKDMKIKVKMFFDGYNYIGVLNNNHYNQEYLLYEKFYDIDDTMDEKLFYYILVKIINGTYTIMYELPPRSKILPHEHIWASYGSFQIGPLLFN